MSNSGPLPGLLALLLRPVALFYGSVTVLRATAYHKGWRRTRKVGAPVISVGNLTAGGSGKTPVVEWIARAALKAERRPVLLSRGYGRKGRSELVRFCGPGSADSLSSVDPVAVGDEPYWLAAKLPRVPVYLAHSRSCAGQLAEVMDAPDLFILDDGFQHIQLARTLNLLLVDTQRGLGNGCLLPSGWLREPLSAARRADAVILTGFAEGTSAESDRRDTTTPIIDSTVTDGPAGLAGSSTGEIGGTGTPAPWAGVLAQLREVLPPATPLFRFGYCARAVRRLDGAEMLAPTQLAGRTVQAFCGIAQPVAFRTTLEALGARVTELVAYPDHEPYAPARLAELAEPHGAASEFTSLAGQDKLCITTEKDAVKLRGRFPHPERIWVLEMAVQPDAAWERYFADFLIRHPAPSELAISAAPLVPPRVPPTA